MFKKIFHTSAVGKSEETLKSISVSESSVSGESEVITAGEIPKPEKRFFLRRPSKIKPTFDGQSLYQHQQQEKPQHPYQSYFRTFDPFDIKSSLRRSSSFSVNTKTGDSENFTSSKIPRSKSVHFAENLTTFHEFKPAYCQDSDEVDSAFKDFLHLRKNDADGESESEELDEDWEEKDGDEDEESQQAEVDNEIEFPKQKDKDSTEACKTSSSEENNGKINDLVDPDAETKIGIKMAEKNLQSAFDGSISESYLGDISKAFAFSFDNSDSTDVESSVDGKKDEESEFLYEIYEQLCDLRQLQACEFSECSTQQLKSDISCGIADIADVLRDSTEQLESSNIEVRKLRHNLQQICHDLETQTIMASRMKSLSKKYKDLQEFVDKNSTQVSFLQEKNKALEALNNADPITPSNPPDPPSSPNLPPTENGFSKIKAELEDRLARSQEEIARLQQELSGYETLQRKEKANSYEKAELLGQLHMSREESKNLQAFQETEKHLLQEQYAKLQNEVNILEKEKLENVRLLETMESSLDTLNVVKEQQLNEATLVVQEISKRYEEKKAQISSIIESLESMQLPQLDKEDHVPSPNDTQKRKIALIDSKKPSATNQIGLAHELIGNVQKYITNLSKQDAIKTRFLEEMCQSNAIAMESLAMLLKTSFEVLIPIFHLESTEQFTQMYCEYSKLQVLADKDRCTIMVLCNFLLNSQRELLSSHQKNEKMLETEINDRLKYQQQVLDSFTSIVKQVLDNKRGTRVSGIRGHSSPKKPRSLSRTPK
ncbi:hypothetical protein JCM33374_g4670 [Metschnikowia sp. JCM 33374]|nr:hypothetical protein JCM33374_g4670 [Metschnikowia sp. JCM 33374]